MAEKLTPEWCPRGEHWEKVAAAAPRLKRDHALHGQKLSGPVPATEAVKTNTRKSSHFSNRRIAMTMTEDMDVIEEELPGSRKVPEVDVHGDEAVIRLNTPEGMEERKVKLPKTTWG
jgi:hypothetical protein